MPIVLRSGPYRFYFYSSDGGEPPHVQVARDLLEAKFWEHGMSSSAESTTRPVATTVHVTEETLTVELGDGRTVSIPTMWYPRLDHATAEEREGWELIGGGTGIHWESIDEDISVEALLAGKGSNESQESLRRWLNKRGV